MDLPLPQPGCESARVGAGMHCLAYESLWHVMFGMAERLTPRSEDVALPLFLRISEADGSDLPGGTNSTMYLSNAGGEGGDVAWLEELALEKVDMTGARAIGY